MTDEIVVALASGYATPDFRRISPDNLRVMTYIFPVPCSRDIRESACHEVLLLVPPHAY